MIGRRSLITGLISFLAAPAIVRASSLMPVRALPIITEFNVRVGKGFLLFRCVGGGDWRELGSVESIQLIPQDHAVPYWEASYQYQTGQFVLMASR